MFLLVSIINIIYWALIILLLGRAIFSWVRVDPYDPTWGRLQQFVFQATEPMLQPIRNLLPQTGMIDLSPLILLIGLGILRSLIFNILF